MPLYGGAAAPASTRTSGLRFFTKAFTSFTTFSPFMFGTRRIETLSSARGGTIVLTPGPV